MIIARKHLPILDVVAVLLFSLLANYVLPINLEFGAPIDWPVLIKLTLLTTSSLLFYVTVDRLKGISSYCLEEYAAESSLAARAKYSIDDRYAHYYRLQKLKLNTALAAAIVLVTLFFLVDPLSKLLR